MKKKLAIIAVLWVMMSWGCGQDEKPAEVPASTPAPVAAPSVEQIGQQAEEAVDSAVKKAEKVAGTVEQKAAETIAVVKEKTAVVAEKVEQATAKVEKVAAKVMEPASTVNPPETVTLDNKMGAIILPHKKHAVAQGCPACHGDNKPGPFTLGKDAGHALCQGCHKQKQAGPTTCNQCHQKKAKKAVEGC